MCDDASLADVSLRDGAELDFSVSAYLPLSKGHLPSVRHFLYAGPSLGQGLEPNAQNKTQGGACMRVPGCAGGQLLAARLLLTTAAERIFF